MLNIYCEKCRTPQKNSEKLCAKCGQAFGGELWILLTGFCLLTGLPILFLLAGENPAILMNNTNVLIGYYVPIISGTAFLYDYHPTRRFIYLLSCISIVGIWLWSYATS
jgi:hypothetical protein